MAWSERSTATDWLTLGERASQPCYLQSDLGRLTPQKKNNLANLKQESEYDIYIYDIKPWSFFGFQMFRQTHIVW